MAQVVTHGATFVISPQYRLSPNSPWINMLIGLSYHMNDMQLDLFLPVKAVYIHIDEFNRLIEPARMYLSNPPILTLNESLTNKFLFCPMEPSFWLEVSHFDTKNIHYSHNVTVDFSLSLKHINKDYGLTSYSCTVPIEDMLTFLVTLEQELEPFKHAIKAP